jgi:hypothetical protein
VPLDGVPQWKISPHFVAVATALSTPLDVPCLFQIRDDALNRAFRDAYEISDVTYAHPGFARDAQ